MEKIYISELGFFVDVNEKNKELLIKFGKIKADDIHIEKPVKRIDIDGKGVEQDTIEHVQTPVRKRGRKKKDRDNTK